jgi:hypothetical protein
MTEDTEILSAFEQAKTDARAEYAEFSLHAMVEHMKLMQMEKEEVEAALSLINAKLDTLRLEMIPAKMEEDGVERITYEGIGRVSLTGDMYTQVVDKPGLYDWLEGNGFGDLIQLTINASTLKAFVKGRVKAGKEIPTDFIKIAPFTRASITKG